MLQKNRSPEQAGGRLRVFLRPAPKACENLVPRAGNALGSCADCGERAAGLVCRGSSLLPALEGFVTGDMEPVQRRSKLGLRSGGRAAVFRPARNPNLDPQPSPQVQGLKSRQSAARGSSRRCAPRGGVHEPSATDAQWSAFRTKAGCQRRRPSPPAMLGPRRSLRVSAAPVERL